MPASSFRRASHSMCNKPIMHWSEHKASFNLNYYLNIQARSAVCFQLAVNILPSCPLHLPALATGFAQRILEPSCVHNVAIYYTLHN